MDASPNLVETATPAERHNMVLARGRSRETLRGLNEGRGLAMGRRRL